MESQPHGYQLYWKIWFILLLMTVTMVSVGSATLPRIAFVIFLLVAMLFKASLIGGYFMHLRFEKLGLIATVAASILLTAAALFLLLIPDALRILETSRP